MRLNSDPLLLTAKNPEAGDQPVVYVGESCTIILTFINNTNGPIPLTTGDKGSALDLLMPRFYTNDQVSKMIITAKDWKPSPETGLWGLKYTGSETQWPVAGTFTFEIKGAISTAQPTTDTILITPYMGDNLPYSVPATLALNDPPPPGNRKLSEYLDVALTSQGSVYVSTKVDPIPNTLFLNLKNKSQTDNLYTGKEMWKGKPQVKITFVYGSTAGALAPNDDPHNPGVDSAWNIKVGVDVGTGWQTFPPTIDGNKPPMWVVKPADTNQPILGTGDSANITFAFSDIKSFTSPGHTQMYVQFTGFMRDEHTAYADQLFVIDISKQMPPPTRGLVNFFGTDPLMTVYNPNTPIPVKLQWSMFDVPKVRLLTSYPTMSDWHGDHSYPNFSGVGYDKTTINLAGVTESGPTFFTAQSFDGQGNYLNSMQFALFVQAQFFKDPRDSQLYAAYLFGRTLWMAQNLNYASAASHYYNDDGGNANPYGRLYTIADAKQAPAGWRLPTETDWMALFSYFGSAQNAFAALITGGSSTFEARLGGSGTMTNNQMVYNADLSSYGYYWTATQGSAAGRNIYAQFSGDSGSAVTGADYPDNVYISVRYVKDL